MKNLLLFALTLAGAVPCFGQMIDPLDEVKTREKTLSNRIQKSIQWSYKYENGKPSKDGTISVVTTYNKDGYPVEVANYNSGKLSTIQKYAYDLKGNKSEYTNFDADQNKKIYSQTFTYNDRGLLVREDGYDGLFPYNVIHTYDSNDKVIKITKIDVNKNVEEQWDYQYSDTVIAISITKKGKLTNKQRIVTNSRKQKVEEVKMDANNKELRKTSYYYNPMGQIEKRDEFVGGIKRYTHQYLYDSENKLIQVVQIEASGKQFPYSTYKYDSKGNLLQEQWSENKGIEYSKKDSSYNPKDILTEVDTYYAPYEYQVLYKYTYEFYNN
ncbi:hypothetical protein [Alistipes sp. ZOR0009]|jgi:hypothetical protein|uniref:hypothetical protein n=1 Tax=Alistipes sp. ZOR0009 TaxID=1339253 RepID=UPI0006478938|nr:hypothetical protein [Alistipes sp. ZOR0009]